MYQEKRFTGLRKACKQKETVFLLHQQKNTVTNSKTFQEVISPYWPPHILMETYRNGS